MHGLARNSIFFFDGHISSNGPVSVAMLVFRNVYGGGSVQEGDG